MKKILLNCTFLLSFFPSTLYFLIPSNEVQPLYIISALPLLIYGISDDRISRIAIKFIILIVLYIFLSLFLDLNSYKVIINGLSYIAPFVGFLVILRNSELLSSKVLFIVIFIWFSVGIIQYFDSFELLKPIIGEIGKFFIADRFEAYRVVGGADGRGVSFLMPEPSGSALVIIAIFGSIQYFYSIGKISFKFYIFFNIITLIMIFLNGSGTCFILFFTYILGLLINKNNKYYIFLIFLPITLITLINLISNSVIDSRIFILIKMIFDLFINNNEISINQFIVSIIGLRFFNTIYSYGSIFDNYALGHGISGWSDLVVQFRVMDLLDLQNLRDSINPNLDFGDVMKPWSLFSILIYDCGIFALCLILIFCFRVLCLQNKKLNWNYLLPAITVLFFFPPVTILSPWILLIYSIKDNKNYV
jgi:hypothetical protein